jgi:FMN reductase
MSDSSVHSPTASTRVSGCPFILGIGGTTREGSSSECALRLALNLAETAGARVQMLAGRAVELPMYAPERPHRSETTANLVAAMREADGIIVSSPAYHGSVSGMIKNALDYAEDLRGDRRPYLDGRAVGLIVCATGWQATGTTLMTLRSVVNALRGWPTPMSVAINSAAPAFNTDGSLLDGSTANQLSILVRQVVDFAVRAGAGVNPQDAIS